MKVMIKTELERAFKSWSLWLALIIGMGLSIAQIIWDYTGSHESADGIYA